MRYQTVKGLRSWHSDKRAPFYQLGCLGEIFPIRLLYPVTLTLGFNKVRHINVNDTYTALTGNNNFFCIFTPSWTSSWTSNGLLNSNASSKMHHYKKEKNATIRPYVHFVSTVSEAITVKRSSSTLEMLYLNLIIARGCFAIITSLPSNRVFLRRIAPLHCLLKTPAWTMLNTSAR